ncbi:hypothetical protein KLMA_10355 [Kluyveromyces marxianus]|nr:hypothetical protein KLMA_10355 [Kluyveromyces marxianus]
MSKGLCNRIHTLQTLHLSIPKRRHKYNQYTHFPIIIMPNTKTYRTHRTHSRSLPRRSIPHRLAPPSQQAKDDKNNNIPMATFQNENGNMNPFEPVPITFYYVVFPHNESRDAGTNTNNNAH